MKTVRFTQVVERCGQPSVHTLWTAPDQDPELKRAQQSNRLMMVVSPESGKAEQGVIGFDPKSLNGAQLLIFPRSLKPFGTARVIGIKFDLIAQPKTVFATPPRPSQRSARPSARPATTSRDKKPDTSPPRAPQARPAETASTRLPSAKQAPLPTAHKAPSSQPLEVRDKRLPPAASPAPEPDASDSALLREVQAALSELKSGKTAAARQRLKAALRDP